MFASLSARLRSLASLFWREVAKFGTVGAVAFVIDNALTWILMHGALEGSPAKARFVGASIATLFSWVANRWWTFRHRRQSNVGRELVQFLLINGVGIVISTGFTWVARYPMGITDNNVLFMAGVVGIVVATVLRFFAYRFWVFNEELDKEPGFEDDARAILGETAPAERPAQSPAVEHPAAEHPAAERPAAVRPRPEL